jgi:hypothetical protein
VAERNDGAGFSIQGGAMDEGRVQALIADLDRLVPREGAVVWEDHGLYGSEVDPAFGGNRAGYLRLGIEFLKVADAPAVPGQPERVRADLSYLLKADLVCGEEAIFERREVGPADLAAPQPRPGPLARGLQWAGLVIAFLVLGIALLLGLMDLVRRVSGWLAA